MRYGQESEWPVDDTRRAVRSMTFTTHSQTRMPLPGLSLTVPLARQKVRIPGAEVTALRVYRLAPPFLRRALGESCAVACLENGVAAAARIAWAAEDAERALSAAVGDGDDVVGDEVMGGAAGGAAW